MATLSGAKAALTSFLASPTEPETILNVLEQLKSIEMTFSLLQESELGKIVTQVKKVVKDHVKASELAGEVLAVWKEVAAKEAAARKRKREENGAAEELSSPTPEKKSKYTEPSTTPSTSSAPASSSSAANSAAISTGPAPTMTVPANSLRRDFVTRISDSLKELPSTTIAKLSKACLDTAILIEAAVHDHFKSSNEEYKLHLKLVNFHLKSNIALRESVALSHIEPSKIATMNPDDLVSAEMKAEAERIAYEVTEARKPVQLEANCTTETCKKCHGKNIHVREAQTRSSDEPMTQFFTCLDCKMKWKR